ncbi:MAG: hypothetical protein IPK55_12055 [Streptococcus sp.]|nr:hypothetical protein [Streptococcus sp.]
MDKVLNCQNSYTAVQLASITLQNLCPCTAGTVYTVRVTGLMNLLESNIYAGSLTVKSYVNANEKIGSESKA